jgi:peptidoglycan/xylan/chitin deacetylase (PgdA/CDA1 family)
MNRIFLTFDTEDFISHNSIPVLKKILESLRKYDLRGMFFITGHMAERIRSFPEILHLLEDHEIGYHSSSHSVHPTIYEFTDVMSYEEALRVSLMRESSHINPLTGKIEGKGGMITLRETFPGKSVDTFRAPGHCWSPPHLEALKNLGVKSDFSTNICRTPTRYRGITYYPYPIIGHWNGRPSDYRLLLNAIIRNKLSVMTIHPHLFATRSEWDAIYYGSNPTEITEPTPRNGEEVASLMKGFELLLRRIAVLQRINAIEVTASPEKPDRELNTEEVDVKQIYHTSIKWAIKQNYRPKFLYGHFLRFFGLSSKLQIEDLSKAEPAEAKS